LTAAVPLQLGTMAPGVAHLLAGRRAEASQVGHDTLGHVRPYKAGGAFLVVAADWASARAPRNSSSATATLRVVGMLTTAATGFAWVKCLRAVPSRRAWPT
jgi:hypothetical protein